MANGIESSIQSFVRGRVRDFKRDSHWRVTGSMVKTACKRREI
jgi:hypothetical protein